MNEEERILIKRIVARIRYLRETKGVSQRLMYYDTDLNIGRIETGEHNISITTIQKICKYFDISFADFFQDFEK